MGLGPTTLLVYGILMVLGGLMGLRAGSRASLYAGSGSGLLLLVAWLVTRVSPAAGLWMGLILTVLLTLTFAGRWKKTGKFMPAGLLLLVSLVALVVLAMSVFSG
jgi:uncharacterized membrane protein (UPF0136 family)